MVLVMLLVGLCTGHSLGLPPPSHFKHELRCHFLHFLYFLPGSLHCPNNLGKGTLQHALMALYPSTATVLTPLDYNLIWVGNMSLS